MEINRGDIEDIILDIIKDSVRVEVCSDNDGYCRGVCVKLILNGKVISKDTSRF